MARVVQASFYHPTSDHRMAAQAHPDSSIYVGETAVADDGPEFDMIDCRSMTTAMSTTQVRTPVTEAYHPVAGTVSNEATMTEQASNGRHSIDILPTSTASILLI
jgi:hypothetical protein